MTPSVLDTLCSAGPAFLSAQRFLQGAQVALVGVPFDGTASFRAGTRFGPDAIRQVSIALETYSPHQDLDLEDITLADLGNLEVGTGHPELVARQSGEVCRELVEQDVTPLLLGGDHSWTAGCIHELLELFPDLLVVQWDAHADLRESFLGEPYSHASGMRRVLEKLPSESLLQVGIRSGTREEWQELRESQRYLPVEPALLQQHLQPFLGRPIYLTFDLDLFDPAAFPGTGVPEPGGIFWKDFEGLLNSLQGHNLIAADVVELSPRQDHSQASSILAAKVVRELILRLANQGEWN